MKQPMSEHRNDIHPDSENPEKLTGIRTGDPATKAAGLTAVVSSIKHVLHEMNGGRAFKALQAINQKDGFDCPGCAWPDPDGERSRLGEFCENGAKAVAEESTTKVLMAEFFRENAVSALSHRSDFEIGKQGRVGIPVYLPAGADHYQPISWEAAFSLIASHLHALASPDEAIFYTSGRTSNEAAFLYQLWVREFGTNNLPDCSNMCHESSGVALMETLGTGKGSVTLEDFYKTELIIILGQNPGTNHPRMLTALQKAKRNGAAIISINPLKEPGLVGFSNPQTVGGMLGMKTEIADLHLPVKINGDMALLQAIELLLIRKEEENPGVLDQDFIKSHTSGFAEWSAHLQSSALDELAEMSGVSVEQIQAAADLISKKKKIIACWAMGLTQHKNAVDTIKEVVNLLLMKGSVGKEGAGTCPVRGHSNVQGDRTMGIYEKPAPAFLDKLDEVFGIRSPRVHGYDVVKSIEAMHAGKAKVFIAMGGNFLSACPDTLHTAEALEQCALTVHISTKLNRSHLVHGRESLILPCLGRADKDIQNGKAQFVTCENSMSVVHMSRGLLAPVSSDLLSEPAIVCRMARAVQGPKSKISWEQYEKDYDLIRSDIARVIPGFEDYNNRVRQPGGFYLGNAVRSLQFNNDTSKAKFTTSRPTRHLLADDELLMMTIRSHDQFNTTIYGLDDRYRGIYHERRVILMNEKDIRKGGWKSGDLVDIHNSFNNTPRVAKMFIVVPYGIPEGCVATYFPETNVLVPVDSTADKSNTPTSKTVVVRLSKHELPAVVA